jgi:hypothetical protein
LHAHVKSGLRELVAASAAVPEVVAEAVEAGIVATAANDMSEVTVIAEANSTTGAFLPDVLHPCKAQLTWGTNGP